MILKLESSVQNPEISDLIFWVSNRTPEEIVDEALRYKPIIILEK